MTDPEIPNALSQEEWTRGGLARIAFDLVDAIIVNGELCVDARRWDKFVVTNRHALAALCLYQQSFGFDHDDAEFLKLVAAQVDVLRLGPEKSTVLRDIAARIAALLPPPTP